MLWIQRLGELRTDAKVKLSGHDTTERPQTGGRERQKWKRLNTCTTVFTKTPTIAQAVPGKGLRPVAWTDRMKGDNGFISQSLVPERIRKYRGAQIKTILWTRVPSFRHVAQTSDQDFVFNQSNTFALPF